MNEFITILQGKMGSHSYGTSTPQSDLDTMGIVIPYPAKDYYLGLKHFGKSDTVDYKDDRLDSHYYEIKKFCGLALKANANVLPLLFLRPEDYLHVNKSGEQILKIRDAFISKKVYHTFCGYAAAQQKRMLGVTTGQLGQKRKDLIDAYGYDTKFAFHTIRLLKMCAETLMDGVIQVYREDDKDFLLDIRNGKYTVEEILSMVESLEKDCHTAFELSSIPDNPDYELVNKTVVEIVGEYTK